MRIVHLSDLHWTGPLGWPVLEPRGVWAWLNQALRGSRFDEQVQAAAVEATLALRPDLVLITGDLTFHGTPREIARAYAALTPLLRELPALVLRGNHETYTHFAARHSTFRAVFGRWMGATDRSRGSTSQASRSLASIRPAPAG